MGKLIWHQWARLLALTAATYMTWASLWAFAYRKFFWDFVPNDTARVFNRIIIDLPILQSATMLLALTTIMIELPLPLVAGTAVHRSQFLRVVLYLFTAAMGLLVYQTFDSGVYYTIAAIAYGRSMYLKEAIDGGNSGGRERAERAQA